MKVTTLVLAALIGTACAAHQGKVSTKLAQVNQALDDCGVEQAQATPVDIDEEDFSDDIDLSWCDCYYELPGLANGVTA